MQGRSALKITLFATLSSLPIPLAAQSDGGPGGPKAADVTGPSKPAPRLPDGHPDLNGHWKGTRNTVPTGNIAKDLPGLKLPLTPAGEAAWKHNVTATIDPESRLDGTRGYLDPAPLPPLPAVANKK